MSTSKTTMKRSMSILLASLTMTAACDMSEEEAPEQLATDGQEVSCSVKGYISSALSLLGNIPVLSTAVNLASTVTSAAGYFNCEESREEMIKEVQEVARGVFDAGLITVVENAMEDVSSRLARFTLTEDYLVNIVSSLSIAERVLEGASYQAMKVQVGASTLKLGAFRVLLEIGSKDIIAHGQNMLTAIDMTEQRLATKAQQVEDYLAKHKVTIETFREYDEVGGWTNSARGWIEYANGTKVVAVDWTDCSGRTCSTEAAVRQAAIVKLNADNAAARAKIFDSVYTKLKTSLPSMRTFARSRMYNLSLHKATTQSAAASSRWSAYAVDGTASTYSRTQAAAGAWWQVDLGFDHAVRTVTVQRYSSALSNFRVELRNASGRVLATKQYPGSVTSSASFNFSGTTGRFLRIINNTSTSRSLELREVNVLAN